MRRSLSVVLLCLLPLLCAADLHAQKKPLSSLRIQGDTVVVVKSLPCKVIAVEGADLYSWSYPVNVDATAFDNILTINKAPQGTFKVSVLMITVVIDFDKKTKTVLKETGEIEVNFGGVKPPDPSPDLSDLAKAFKRALDSETDAMKIAHAKSLATIYSEGAKQTQMGTPKTIGDLFRSMDAGAKVAGVNGKVLSLQAAIAKHCADIPKLSNTPIDDNYRTLIVRLFTEVASALKEVAP